MEETSKLLMGESQKILAYYDFVIKNVSVNKKNI